MKSFLVSEDLPESHDALKNEVARLRRLNEQLVRELETRTASDHKNSKSDSHGNQKADPQNTAEAFRESEARLRQVTDNISEVLWLQTCLLYTSPSPRDS